MMGLARIVAGAAAGLALLASATAAAQSAARERVRVDPGAAPWRSVGKLQAVAGGLRETCTAALVGPDTVATAAHCLYNLRTRRPFLPSSVHFLLGLEGARFASATLARSFSISPAYDPASEGATRGSDWALVVLDAPLDRALVLALAPAPPAPGTRVMVGGYGQDKANVLTADLACQVVGLRHDARGERMLVHDCASVHGISGAPLLVRGEAGWAVVGINVAAARTGAGGLAVLVEALAGRP
jgi:protease YdgD